MSSEDCALSHTAVRNNNAIIMLLLPARVYGRHD